MASKLGKTPASQSKNLNHRIPADPPATGQGGFRRAKAAPQGGLHAPRRLGERGGAPVLEGHRAEGGAVAVGRHAAGDGGGWRGAGGDGPPARGPRREVAGGGGS